MTLTNNAFTRAGYTFAGWNTRADGSADAYTNAHAFSPWNLTGDLTALEASVIPLAGIGTKNMGLSFE